MTKYARVGEKVTVREFTRFKRAGYPLTLPMVGEKFKEEVGNLICRMEAVLLLHATPGLPDGISQVVPEKADSFVISHLRAAAKGHILRREGFGGRERKVYEMPFDPVECDDQTGELLPVVKRRTVVTGTYFPGCEGGWVHSDYDDYDPPELCDRECHCVYTLEGRTRTGLPFRFDILASHCDREGKDG